MKEKIELIITTNLDLDGYDDEHDVRHTTDALHALFVQSQIDMLEEMSKHWIPYKCLVDEQWDHAVRLETIKDRITSLKQLL